VIFEERTVYVNWRSGLEMPPHEINGHRQMVPMSNKSLW